MTPRFNTLASRIGRESISIISGQVGGAFVPAAQGKGRVLSHLFSYIWCLAPECISETIPSSYAFSLLVIFLSLSTSERT